MLRELNKVFFFTSRARAKSENELNVIDEKKRMCEIVGQREKKCELFFLLLIEEFVRWNRLIN